MVARGQNLVSEREGRNGESTRLTEKERLAAYVAYKYVTQSKSETKT